MKAITILFIFSLFMSCLPGNSPANKNVSSMVKDTAIRDSIPPFQSVWLKDPLETYSKSDVIYAVYYTDSTFRSRVKMPEYACDLGKELDVSPSFTDSLLTIAEESIKSMDDSTRTVFFKHFYQWMQDGHLLDGANILVHSSEVLNQIFNQIPATKKLLSKYVGPNGHPDSLSENQSCALWLDILAYLNTLPRKERLLFFKQYYNLAFKSGLEYDDEQE